MDLTTDAARGIGRWVDRYNHGRTHHGLGGILVPADRFYGVVKQTMKKIEQDSALIQRSPVLINAGWICSRLFLTAVNRRYG
jgi:hypothetical protein